MSSGPGGGGGDPVPSIEVTLVAIGTHLPDDGYDTIANQMTVRAKELNGEGISWTLQWEPSLGLGAWGSPVAVNGAYIPNSDDHLKTVSFFHQGTGVGGGLPALPTSGFHVYRVTFGAGLDGAPLYDTESKVITAVTGETA